MPLQQMENEVSLLDDLITVERKKPKLHNVITVFSLLFFAYFIFQLAFGDQITWNSAQIVPMIVITMLPALGLLFHIIGRKTGWILNTVFYTLMTAITSANIIFNIIASQKLGTNVIFNWRSLVLFLVTTTLVTLLLTRPVRRYFNVSSLAVVICLGIPIALAALYFFYYLKKFL